MGGRRSDWLSCCRRTGRQRSPWQLVEREAEFYEPPEYEALVAAAAEVGPDVHALVLLMGDAGLRQGEVCDCTGITCAGIPSRSSGSSAAATRKKDQPGTKNRKTRAMLMTPRLAEALRTLPRARRQTHVLVRRDELPMTPKAIQLRLEKAEAGPGLNPKLHRPKP